MLTNITNKISLFYITWIYRKRFFNNFDLKTQSFPEHMSNDIWILAISLSSYYILWLTYYITVKPYEHYGNSNH